MRMLKVTRDDFARTAAQRFRTYFVTTATEFDVDTIDDIDPAHLVMFICRDCIDKMKGLIG